MNAAAAHCTVAVLGDAVAIARNASYAQGVGATFAIAEKVVIRLVAHQVATRLPAEVGGRARVAPSIVREAAIFVGLLAILVVHAQLQKSISYACKFSGSDLVCSDALDEAFERGRVGTDVGGAGE